MTRAYAYYVLMDTAARQQSLDKLLDLTCGSIEALRQACDFIAALDRHACAEVTGTQRIDAALQALQSYGQLPNDGESCHADCQCREYHQQMKIQSGGAEADGHAGDQ